MYAARRAVWYQVQHASERMLRNWVAHVSWSRSPEKKNQREHTSPARSSSCKQNPQKRARQTHSTRDDHLP